MLASLTVASAAWATSENVLVERVTTAAPFPRGLVMVDGRLYILCRGRVRGAGGVSAEIDDQAGTIRVPSGLNDRLIIQEGVTKVDGKLIDTLAGVEDGFATSDSGRFIIFEAVLAGGVDGAFLAIVPRAGDLNCDGLIDLLDVEPFINLLLG